MAPPPCHVDLEMRPRLAQGLSVGGADPAQGRSRLTGHAMMLLSLGPGLPPTPTSPMSSSKRSTLHASQLTMKVALSLVIVASLLAAGAESTSVKKQPHHRQIAVNNFGPPARVGLSKLAPPVSTVVNSGPVQTIKGYSLLSKPVATTPAGVSRNLLGGVSNLVSSLLGGDKPAPSASPSHSRKPSSTPLPPAPYETPSKGY